MRQLQAGVHRQMRRTAYAVLDAGFLGRGVPRRINGERVRFPATWSRYYPSIYERAKHRFLLEHCVSGSTVIDGGAHIGLFTISMAKAVGREGWVLSFEPAPDTRRILAMTVAMNDYGASVSVRPEGLSIVTGATTLHLGATEGSNSNSLIGLIGAHGKPCPRGPEKQVPTLALDDLLPTLAAPVSCIKLDIEGAELDALRGARTMLERFHPALCVEVHPRMLRAADQEPTEVRDLVVDLGYRLYDGPGECPPERFEQDDLFEFQAL